MSDIDDIFSSIHKPKSSSASASIKINAGSTRQPQEGEPGTKLSKKALKKARKAAQKTNVETKEVKKEVKSETVAAVHVADHTLSQPSLKSNISKRMLQDDQDGFFDSRGSNGKRKKTEEGFDIYHEDELKIGLGGDTEECPFDCACCY